jgi:hypothetical protein
MTLSWSTSRNDRGAGGEPAVGIVMGADDRNAVSFQLPAASLLRKNFLPKKLEAGSWRLEADYVSTFSR